MTLLKSIQDWRQVRRTRSALRRLDDRVLIDAGIPRWRIDDVARGAPIDDRLVM